jgi:ABC-2 type transport system ATP-binding protein
MKDFVTVSRLTKKYGDLTAVDNLDFSVKQGEIFGFLGPNGAGKSTTLSVLCAISEYDIGDIHIGGYDLSRQERQIKRLIGLVPQDIALYPTLTAYENVAFFTSLYGIRGQKLRRQVKEALSFVGLSDHEKKHAGKMSSGMQRRLNIACGIAHKPQLIVMDEPTVGVDAQSREHIMNSIRLLRDEGATVIYTSHYMPEVQEICDRIAIIDHGKLAAIGTENELLELVTDKKSVMIKTKLPANPARVTDSLSVIPDVKKVRYNADAGELKIDVSLSFDSMAPILQVLMAENAPVDALTAETPNLETTFLALTGRELR